MKRFILSLLVAFCVGVVPAAADDIDTFSNTAALGAPVLSSPGAPVNVADSGAEFGSGNRGFSMSTAGLAGAINTAQIAGGQLVLGSAGQGVGSVELNYTPTGGSFADLTAAGKIFADFIALNVVGASNVTVQLTDSDNDTFTFTPVALVGGANFQAEFDLTTVPANVNLGQITNLDTFITIGGDSDFRLDLLSSEGEIQEIPIPEPASMAIWAIAGSAGGLYLIRRRRKKKIA